MKKQNLHTHTIFCDGKNTAEEMVQAAIAKGFTSLGFSGHAPLPHENAYCMMEEDYPNYVAEIRRLKEAYADQLEIFLGLENECAFPWDKTGLDYTISSVHIITKGDLRMDVDNRYDILADNVRDHYDGKIYDYIQDYYNLVVKASKKGDILGHFDIIGKFNEKRFIYDELGDRYVSMAKEALRACLEQDIILEINTGAMARGHRTVFYPHPQFLDMMAEHKARILVTSDAHTVDGLGYYYDEAVQILKAHGFRAQQHLTKSGFVDVPL